MAKRRKGRVSDRLKRQLARKERGRRQAVRAIRRYILIICEGEKTEPNYFEAFKGDLPKGVLDSVNIDIDGTGKNTLSLIEEAIRYRRRREKELGRDYDQTWAVFDRDSFPPQNFNNAIFKAREAMPEIHAAWSNEAFELWYLLHFEFYQSALSRDQYKQKLEDNIAKRSGQPFAYRKNDQRLYDLLKEYGDVERAIKWATQLEDEHDGENFAEHNPCTKVHRLVQVLLALKVGAE